ncbi:hypothetical protein [Sphingobium ummariense]
MTTRRQILAAALAAPVIAVPVHATSVTASNSPAATSPEWDMAEAAMREAERAYMAYYRSTYDPAWLAWKRREEEQEEEMQRLIDAIPHRTTIGSYVANSGKTIRLTTANFVHVGWARASEKWTDDGIHTRCSRELAEYVAERDMREREIREAFARKPVPGIPASIEKEHSRLDGIYDAAFKAVRDFEPLCVGDLFGKVAMLKHLDIDLDHDDMLADLRSVLGGAA